MKVTKKVELTNEEVEILANAFGVLDELSINFDMPLSKIIEVLEKNVKLDDEWKITFPNSIDFH